MVKDSINGIKVNLLSLRIMTVFGYEITFELVVLAVLGIALLVQLFYYLYFFLRLTLFKQKEIETNLPPVSVVICARNEEKNILENLPKIFDQDYPEYQVVVVNDRSWDETGDVLRAFQKRYDNLHVVSVPENDHYKFGKKLAVTLGIKGAKHEHLLFTDADCEPVSKQWIRKMVSSFQSKSLILGYSPYKKKKGFLNKLIRFDTVQIGVQYLSFALAGLPYMGVGRNMSYKKELFWSVSGFKSHYHIPSGDDDLFVNEVGAKKGVNIVVDPEAQMVSQPKETYADWWRQKRRHFTTAKHYKFHHKLFLGLYPASIMLFILSFIVLLFTSFWKIALIAFAFRMLVQLLILNKPMKLLGGKDLLFLTPFIEVFMLLVNPLIYFSNFVVKPTRWN